MRLRIAITISFCVLGCAVLPSKAQGNYEIQVYALGWDYVGSHIRPRVRVPPKWHWPVGVSLSNEIGWQGRRYSADTQTWEIRPIVDKQLGPWYLSFNPTFGVPRINCLRR